MSYYSSDELKESVYFEELDVSFGSKVEDLEDALKPLVKEKNFDYKKFKNLLTAKVEFVAGRYWYPFDQKVYEFLRPFIPHFPVAVGISAFWCYEESIDMVFYGAIYWDSDEHKKNDLPQDFRDLLYFSDDSDDIGNPHEFLQDCNWVTDHEEEVKEWLKKRYKEDGEEYDDDELDDMTYDSFKRYWKDFKVEFPEAWKSFKDYVWGKAPTLDSEESDDDDYDDDDNGDDDDDDSGDDDDDGKDGKVLFSYRVDDGDDGKDQEKALSYAHQAGSHAENGDYSKAIEIWNKAIECAPLDVIRLGEKKYEIKLISDLIASRAIVYKLTKQYDKAIEDYNQAIDHSPGVPSYLESRAGTYMDKGDFTKAIEDYKKVLELDPDNEDAEDMLARCEAALKKAKPATTAKPAPTPTQSAPAGNPVCPKCGKVASKPTSKFCAKCGTKLKETCAKCGYELAPDTNFCPKCGAKKGN